MHPWSATRGRPTRNRLNLFRVGTVKKETCEFLLSRLITVVHLGYLVSSQGLP